MMSTRQRTTERTIRGLNQPADRPIRWFATAISEENRAHDEPAEGAVLEHEPSTMAGYRSKRQRTRDCVIAAWRGTPRRTISG